MGIVTKYLTCLVCVLVWSEVECVGKLVELQDESWNQILEGEWMVQFFAPWCPACKSLQPIWEDFAAWSSDLNIKVGRVDVTSNPGMSGRFMVTALPTIYHVKEGEFRMYRDARAKEAFISFIEDAKWKNLETMSAWKSPDSYLMSVVSYFFKLSMLMRTAHTHMIEAYGIPYWASYITFALGTVLVGAVLGLILVCLIDCFYPPKCVGGMSAGDSAVQEVPDDADMIQDADEAGPSQDGRMSDGENRSDWEEGNSQSEGEAIPGDEEGKSAGDVRKRTVAQDSTSA